MDRRSLAALSALLMTAACGAEAPAPPPAPPATPNLLPASYACDSGTTVAVEYPDPQTARLTYQDATQVLNSQPAASGARYIGRTLEWWTAVRGGQETGVLRRVADNPEAEGQTIERCARAAPDVAAPAPAASPASPPVPQAMGPACRGDQLRLSRDGGDAGAGNRVMILGLQNTGAQACSMLGHPDLTLLDPQGRPVTSLRVEKAPGGYMAESQPAGPVTLAPQAKAYLDLAWNVVPAERDGQTACPTVAGVRVTPPGGGTTQTLAETLSPCGGRVRVSPLRAEPGPSA